MEIPLFPLHTVLAPGLALPLHVFEDRYRALVRHCLDHRSPFGVVLIREGSEVAPPAGQTRELAIAGVGTFAEIREASRHVDGRWDLLAVGAGRFVVQEVDTERAPYLVAEVEPVEDGPAERAITEPLVERVTRRFVDYLRLLQPREGEEADELDVRVELDVDDEGSAGAGVSGEAAGEADEEPGGGPATTADPDDADESVAGSGLAAVLRIPDDPSTLSLLLTGIVQVEPDRKQALLEASTAEERLRDLDALLGRELAYLRHRLAPFALDRRRLAERGN